MKQYFYFPEKPHMKNQSQVKMMKFIWRCFTKKKEIAVKITIKLLRFIQPKNLLCGHG